MCGRWSGNGGKKGRRETEKWDVIDVEGIIQAIFISQIEHFYVSGTIL